MAKSPKPETGGQLTISPHPKEVLLVDDNNETRLATKWLLSFLGCRVHSMRSSEQALALFDPSIHEVIVTENSLAGMTGSELARAIRARSPATPIIMYTAKTPKDESCLDLVISKPTHVVALKDAVARLLLGNHSK